MPDQIYVDPSVADAAVIRYQGRCYRRVGLADELPTVFEVDSSDEFGTCEECQEICSSNSSSSSSSGSSGAGSSSSSLDPVCPCADLPAFVPVLISGFCVYPGGRTEPESAMLAKFTEDEQCVYAFDHGDALRMRMVQDGATRTWHVVIDDDGADIAIGTITFATCEIVGSFAIPNGPACQSGGPLTVTFG